MNIIEIDFKNVTQPKYDNKAAYAELQSMMKQGFPISVSVGVHNKVPCVWVSNKTTYRFPYQISGESFNGFFHYLQTGEITDFDSDPINLTTDEVDEDEFTQDIFKQFVESGINIQLTPLFREYSCNVSGIITLKKGTIFLRTRRTTEFMDYLREKGLVA